MRVLVLRSVNTPAKKEPFSISMDTLYAERFLGHFTNRKGYCGACADNCLSCRNSYNLDFSADIAGIIDFPSTHPVILDDPEKFLPHTVPLHDILLPIAVNEEILKAFIHRFDASKGIVIPRERSNWISPNAKLAITAICKQRGIPVDFPKPFCAFDPPGGILREFKEHFRIGLPQIDYEVNDGRIAKTTVVCSAPCGATYFTARGLQGRRLDENLGYVVDKQLSCFPCTADTSVDPEFNDSIMHQSVKIQRRLLDSLK